MPSYLDEDIEKKMFTILHKKYPERCGEISETNQWEAKVEGMRGVSVGEGVMVFARGEGHVTEVGDGYAMILLTDRRDAPHPGDEVVSTGKPAEGFEG